MYTVALWITSLHQMKNKKASLVLCIRHEDSNIHTYLKGLAK